MRRGGVKATWAALAAWLLADDDVAGLVADRVLDHVPEGVAFPYIRLGETSPAPDDTDTTQGALLQIGLEAHARPEFGRMQAIDICEAIEASLHRANDVGLAIGDGFTLVDIEVQTWSVDPSAKDEKSWRGVVALEVRLGA